MRHLSKNASTFANIFCTERTVRAGGLVIENLRFVQIDFTESVLKEDSAGHEARSDVCDIAQTDLLGRSLVGRSEFRLNAIAQSPPDCTKLAGLISMTPPFDPAALVAAMAPLLRLELDEASRAQVVVHLRIAADMAAKLDAVALDDEAEPAPVYAP